MTGLTWMDEDVRHVFALATATICLLPYLRRTYAFTLGLHAALGVSMQDL